MKTEQAESLEQLIRQSGIGWALDPKPTPAKGLEIIRNRLEQAKVAAAKRGLQMDFSEDALIERFSRSPHKVRASLQALVESDSPEMLVMVWRVLQGMDISELSMTCKKGTFELRIVLGSPYGEYDPAYVSASVEDATLVRHFGVMKMGDESMFVGFYPTVGSK